MTWKSKIRKNALTYSHSFQFAGLFWLSILVLCHLDDLLSNIREEIKTLRLHFNSTISRSPLIGGSREGD